MSNALRQTVFSMLQGSVDLQELGYAADSIYPNYSPDSPSANRFIVLRWGGTARGIGPVSSVLLSTWAYNREPDYAPITDALLVVRTLISALLAVRFADGSGAVSGVAWGGDSPDTFDDGYRAYARSSAHTITASGM